MNLDELNFLLLVYSHLVKSNEIVLLKILNHILLAFLQSFLLLLVLKTTHDKLLVVTILKQEEVAVI